MAKRRAKEEGSIFQRERDGKWVARLELGPHKGVRARKEFSGKTYRIVAKKLKNAQRNKDDGFDYRRVRTHMTVREYLNIWLTEMVAKDRFVKRPRALRTKHDYQEIVRKHLIPRIGDHKLLEFKDVHIEKMLADLEEKLSPRRRQYIFAVLRNAFNNGMKAKYIQKGHNPCDTVEPIAAPDPVITPFGVDEAEKLMATAKARPLDQMAGGSQLEAMVTLSVTTGIRQGELLALTWGDIQLTGATTVRITRKIFHMGTKRDGDFRFVFGRPKSFKSNRTVYLAPMAVDALKTQRAYQESIKKEAGKYWGNDPKLIAILDMPDGPEKDKAQAQYPGKEYDWEDGTKFHLPDELVFTTALGEPMANYNVSYAFRHLVTLAKTRKESFHKTRHSAASYWNEAGFTSFDISTFLGHASPAFTERTYMHMFSKTSQKGADAMQKLFDDQKKTNATDPVEDGIKEGVAND